MFNDERERILLEQHTRAESLQAWVQRVRDEAQHDHLSLRTRAFLWIGKRLIAFGARLTDRFGAPAERRYIAPRDRVFNP